MLLNIGSATDAYQPAERKLGITRSVIEVLQRIPPPVFADHQVGRRRARHRPDRADGRAALAAVYVSITTLDPALARVMEPRAAAPERRLRTIAALAAAGHPGGCERVAGDSVPERARAGAHPGRAATPAPARPSASFCACPGR
jgi:hypothetical protein